jgi:hypothetical protein
MHLPKSTQKHILHQIIRSLSSLGHHIGVAPNIVSIFFHKIVYDHACIVVV